MRRRRGGGEGQSPPDAAEKPLAPRPLVVCPRLLAGSPGVHPLPTHTFTSPSQPRLPGELLSSSLNPSQNPSGKASREPWCGLTVAPLARRAQRGSAGPVCRCCALGLVCIRRFPGQRASAAGVVPPVAQRGPVLPSEALCLRWGRWFCSSACRQPTKSGAALYQTLPERGYSLPGGTAGQREGTDPGWGDWMSC